MPTTRGSRAGVLAVGRFGLGVQGQEPDEALRLLVIQRNGSLDAPSLQSRCPRC